MIGIDTNILIYSIDILDRVTRDKAPTAATASFLEDKVLIPWQLIGEY